MVWEFTRGDPLGVRLLVWELSRGDPLGVMVMNFRGELLADPTEVDWLNWMSMMLSSMSTGRLTLGLLVMSCLTRKSKGSGGGSCQGNIHQVIIYDAAFIIALNNISHLITFIELEFLSWLAIYM